MTKASLFSFKGRTSRMPYWLVGIAIFLAFVAIGLMVANSGESFIQIGMVLFLILGILSTWIGLAVGAKRLHDRDKSAWWLLIFFGLPSVLEAPAEAAGEAGLVLLLFAFVISMWGLIELGFLRGTAGSNRYGPDPLADA